MNRMSKLTSDLYKLSRKLGKTASIINDIETLASGNPKKILKRSKKKTVGKALNKLNRKIINKL